jgi:hypothetical protein
MALPPVQVHDEAHAAGVVLEGGMVEALGGRESGMRLHVDVVVVEESAVEETAVEEIAV